MEGGREDSSHSQLVEVHFVHVRTNSGLVKKYVMYLLDIYVMKDKKIY